MLVNTPEMPLTVSWKVIVPTVAATSGIFIFAIAAGLRAQRRQPTTGPEGLVGQAGVVRVPIPPGGEGLVFVHGEIWKATSDREAMPEGTRVRIVGMDGLTVRVTRAG
jgi:membrane-bound serine protease (ClpP class)